MSEVAYDSRPETWEHIQRVRDLMRVAILNLKDRAEDHDASKLVEPELEAFDRMTPRLAELEYGSEEYKASVRELGPALDHHFKHNDHHPEYHEDGILGMSLMSLLEMLCDWRAASERTKQRFDDPAEVAKFNLTHNKDRFGITPELHQILDNTARELGFYEEAE